MEKEDARKQTLAELHERRKQVIRLHRKGYKVMQIVELSGLSWRRCAMPSTITNKAAWRRSSRVPEAYAKAKDIACHRSRSSRSKAKLKAAATEHMSMLENTPQRVKSYFQDPKEKYAA